MKKLIINIIFSLFIFFDLLANNNNLIYIDTHAHLFGKYDNQHEKIDIGYREAVEEAIILMNKLGIKKTIVMPPPFTFEQKNKDNINSIINSIKKYPDRFNFLGGGESLNAIIHKTSKIKNIDINIQRNFEKNALELLKKGAIGFGEIAIEHFSLNPKHGHPYESISPEHPLLLKLIDIANKYNVPIEIHMEAIEFETPILNKLNYSPNPKILKPNIESFERLLNYNKNVLIIWAHAGWDNTGYRTINLMSKLLDNHSNLYMNIKFGKDNYPLNNIFDKNQNIKPDYLDFFIKYKDRFMIGSDQFYRSKKSKINFPGRIEIIEKFLLKLPNEIRKKIGYENALKIYKLNLNN